VGVGVSGAGADPQADLHAQHSVVLTAHPLQRVGAYVIAALAKCRTPGDVTAEAFRDVVQTMTEDAVQAARVASTREQDGFWLKASMSFFPNSKMNHPSRLKQPPAELADAVRRWRTMPDPQTWPDSVPCALCGRGAVGYFGKMDVALCESDAYRNTTPRGSQGLALCWPCLVCFYALPYGCQLSGGANAVLHSWDDGLLWTVTRQRVKRNGRLLAIGKAPPAGSGGDREVVALQQLCRYAEQITEDVDLLVFSNDNRGPSLTAYKLAQPLAEWLRRTSTAQREAFSTLVATHQTEQRGGLRRFAFHAFHHPERVLTTACAALTSRFDQRGAPPRTVTALAPLCFCYAIEVLAMKENDKARIQSLASNVATLLVGRKDVTLLKKFVVATRDRRQLRTWLTRQAVDWTLRTPETAQGPFITHEQLLLLFEPGGMGWLHQDLLLVSVLEHLYQAQWPATADSDEVEDVLDEMSAGADEDDKEDEL